MKRNSMDGNQQQPYQLVNNPYAQLEIKRPSIPQIKYIAISKSDPKLAFKNNAIEGKYLNKSRFNDTILSILKFNVPILGHTYLCEKIYYMLDEVI
jgi:hypothetical protein